MPPTPCPTCADIRAIDPDYADDHCPDCTDGTTSLVGRVVDLEAEVQSWRELAAAVIMQEHPILPRPDWSQDAAFVAFTIDHLRSAKQ